MTRDEFLWMAGKAMASALNVKQEQDLQDFATLIKRIRKPRDKGVQRCWVYGLDRKAHLICCCQKHRVLRRLSNGRYVVEENSGAKRNILLADSVQQSEG